MKTPRANAGFSLIEVMIAVLIVGVGLVGLAQGITTALRSGKESELQTTAALFAAGKMEQTRADMKLKDEQTEGTCGDILPLYQWKQTITAAPISGLHEVTVIVENAQTGQPKSAILPPGTPAPSRFLGLHPDRNHHQFRPDGNDHRDGVPLL